MSPQFVDFNGDGQEDIVAGTFDGSPHVALGGAKGWQKPEHILDAKGQRILMNQFWDYDARKWTETNRCDPDDGGPLAGHLTSAWAWDRDADGDFDLLLGDYDEGRVFLRVNEGSNAEPKFREKNEIVRAGGSPISVGQVSTIRMVDWNGDDTLDLIVSSAGQSYGGAGETGGVYLFLNKGSSEKPEFASKIDLIPAGPKEFATEPTRPATGLYVDLADGDGDGDLDMLVGGYSFTSARESKQYVWFYENEATP